MNELQGSIPSAFGNLPELQILILAQIRLSGVIPPSLGSSLSLKYVDLGRNALVGGIPESLANSSSLEVLRLMGNSLGGDLPKSTFTVHNTTTAAAARSVAASDLYPAYMLSVSSVCGTDLPPLGLHAAEPL
ncbi:hypothetical protein ACP70R_043274 [Stipagrostis hirtigluma subsp. patula]